VRVRRDDPTSWAAAAGVIVFAASDSTIAVNKFHAPVPHADLAIMVSYWLGQGLITAGAFTGAGTSSSR
jgi:uncharacterized membrane protein YhhN